MTTDPDHHLLDKILSGDQNAYAMLIDKHKRYAFTIAFRILQNRAEAEEAAQDGFIKAYHHLQNFIRESKFSTWLYRIVFNTAITYKRKRKQSFQSIETVVTAYTQEDATLEREDKQKYLMQALTRLPEADRTALSMFYLEEFSLEEIADITGIAANTIKVRIHRARVKLAEELKTILNREALTL